MQYKTALITGASGGIGAAFAEALAANGCDLVLIARSRDKLESLAGKLSAAHGRRVEVLVLDLSIPGAGARVRTAVEAWGLEIDLLINNAGFGTVGPFVRLDPEREQQEIRLNVATLVDLCRTFLPDMHRRRSGAIINIASSAAFQPMPYMAVYGATKVFVQSFSDALWAESRGRGVHVMSVCPGPVETGFFEATGNPNTRKLVDKTPILSAEAVVGETLRGLRARRRMVIPGVSMKAVAGLVRLSPRAWVIRSIERALRA